MKIALVTGSFGIIGSEACRRMHAEGMAVVGIDNDLPGRFLGKEASTSQMESQLRRLQLYNHEEADIRDWGALDLIFKRYGFAVGAVIHAATQSSPVWAAREPVTDFDINALGTMHLLEAARMHCPEAPFVFASTNRVYGDRSGDLPIIEEETRWELSREHPYYANGIDEHFSVDASKHTIMGASKLAADIMVQEYGRSFGLKTGIFRIGNLVGSSSTSGHHPDYLTHLMGCTVTGLPCTVSAYKGKQVWDNLHGHDLMDAFWQFIQAPRSGEVYNMGGSRENSCSALEAIRLCEEIASRKLEWTYAEEDAVSDARWWITDVTKFQSHYPGWKRRHDLRSILSEIHAAYSSNPSPARTS